MDFVLPDTMSLQMDRKGRKEIVCLWAGFVCKQSDQAKHGADGKYCVNKSFIHIVSQSIDQLNADDGYGEADTIHDR